MPESIRIAFVPRYPNAFTDRLARGMSSAISELRASQVQVVMREFELHDQAQTLPPGYSAWSPDAVVVFLSGEHEALCDKLKLGRNIPMIHNSGIDAGENEAVVLNDSTSIYDAAWEHFRSIGRHRVAGLFMGDEPISRLLIERYKRYCQSRGLVFEMIHCPDDFVVDYATPDCSLSLSGPAADWLRSLNEPAGVFTQHSFSGTHFCRLSKELGMRVPDDVAIIASDGFDVSLWSDPPVTSFRNNVEQVGIASVHMALDMIGGKPAPKQHIRIGGTQVIVRGSTLAHRKQGLDIAEAVRFIDQHAFEGITMQDVVEYTQGVSRQTFVKHFKAWTGMTPTQAIRKRKLDESKRMLRDTEMSVTALSRACGFCDDIEFRKVFSKEEGCSPSSFRKTRRA